MPTISIILPTYNRLPLLGEAIESVRRQTFEDWELIVADDGSTDSTLPYLASVREPRLRLVNLLHSGSPARVRNAGLRVSRAEWIAFLDSDDVWMPDKLELQMRALSEHRECGWSCTGVGFIDADGNAIPQPSSRPYRPLSGWILEQLLTFEAAATMPTLVVRRSLAASIGGFDEALTSRADYDFALRLAVESQIHALEETLTLVREHPGRTTRTRNRAELHRFNEMVFRKAETFVPNERLRQICQRQCVTQLVERARALSADGHHSAAFEAIRRALRDAPKERFVWRGALGCAARAVGLGRRAAKSDGHRAKHS